MRRVLPVLPSVDPENTRSMASKEYFLYLLTQRKSGGRPLRVLDFGCGQGRTALYLRERGMDAFGADVFYEGSNFDQLKASDAFRQGIIRAIENGRIPFDDNEFDVVISDQVLEHVEDLPGAVRELARVLKPGGEMFHCFPVQEIWMEGHMALPLTHHFPPGRLRFAWVYALRRLGFGNFKRGRTARDWTEHKLRWLDQFCFYRTEREARAILGERFQIERIEYDHLRFWMDRRLTWIPRWLRRASAGALQLILGGQIKRLISVFYRAEAPPP